MRIISSMILTLMQGALWIS